MNLVLFLRRIAWILFVCLFVFNWYSWKGLRCNSLVKLLLVIQSRTYHTVFYILKPSVPCLPAFSNQVKINHRPRTAVLGVARVNWQSIHVCVLEVVVDQRVGGPLANWVEVYFAGLNCYTKLMDKVRCALWIQVHVPSRNMYPALCQFLFGGPKRPRVIW